MAYINENFNEISDLSGIDEKLEELDAFLANIRRVADSKINPTHRSSLITTGDSQVLVATADITQRLKTLNDTNSITVIGSLIQQYGQVSIITTIKELLESKLQLQNNLRYLERAQSLVSQPLSPALSKEISFLKKSQNPLSTQVLSLLNTELSARVADSRVLLEASLSDVLDKNNWLVASKNTTITDFKPIRSLIEKLLDLQLINNSPTYPDTWWVLDILLQPFFKRFTYHFNSNRPTDKISKPELALEFVLNFLNENLATIVLVVGDIFRQHEKILEFEIITSLLKPVRDKFSKNIKLINNSIKQNLQDEDSYTLEKSGQLLTHLVKELSDFDLVLKNKYKYNPFIESFKEIPLKNWQGITGDIFNYDEENIENWLLLEKKLALKQFNNQILNSTDFHKIDNDYQGSQVSSEQDLKPTISAINLTKLLDNLTSHFQTLISPDSQYKFVKSIQLILLDMYYEELVNQLKYFNDKFKQKTMFSFLSKKQKQEPTSESSMDNGLRALDVLTGLYCSSQFVLQFLDQWSNELIFIQLSDDNIFDGVTKKYNELSEVIIKKFQDFFHKEISLCLKEYVNNSTWDQESIPEANSVELSLLVRTLPVYLLEIRKSISTLQYVFLTDKIVSIIFNLINEYVVQNYEFSIGGAKQLKLDVEFIQNQFQKTLFLGEGNNQFSNASNDSILRIDQSIELFSSIDSFEAIDYFKGNLPLQELRDKFENNLDHLLDHELLGLLPRIQ